MHVSHGGNWKMKNLNDALRFHLILLVFCATLFPGCTDTSNSASLSNEQKGAILADVHHKAAVAVRQLNADANGDRILQGDNGGTLMSHADYDIKNESVIISQTSDGEVIGTKPVSYYRGTTLRYDTFTTEDGLILTGEITGTITGTCLDMMKYPTSQGTYSGSLICSGLFSATVQVTGTFSAGGALLETADQKIFELNGEKFTPLDDLAP